jgi:hypothetical protein
MSAFIDGIVVYQHQPTLKNVIFGTPSKQSSTMISLSWLIGAGLMIKIIQSQIGCVTIHIH